MTRNVVAVTGAIAAAAVVAAGGLLVGTGAAGGALAGSGQNAAQRQPVQVINIQAITMVPRETPACPAAPHPVCESRPGRVGIDAPGSPLGGSLVDAEGTSVAPVHLPAGSRIVRIEIVGVDTQRYHSNSSEPAATATLLRYRIGEGERGIVGAGTSHSKAPRRFLSGPPNPARAVVRADSSYYIWLTIPRATQDTHKAIQMVRVVYRPPAR